MSLLKSSWIGYCAYNLSICEAEVEGSGHPGMHNNTLSKQNKKHNRTEQKGEGTYANFGTSLHLTLKMEAGEGRLRFSKLMKNGITLPR